MPERDNVVHEPGSRAGHDGGDTNARLHHHPANVTRYRLANARVPVCLVADAAQLRPMPTASRPATS